eukprot:1953551-Pyramimonas_sp.AAC.1
MEPDPNHLPAITSCGKPSSSSLAKSSSHLKSSHLQRARQRGTSRHGRMRGAAVAGFQDIPRYRWSLDT